MTDLEIPLSFDDSSNHNREFKSKRMLTNCSYCSEKIKNAALIGCHRCGQDFLKMNYDSTMLYFCDFICAKLYDTNVNYV
jgi:hypothetical protein